MDASPSARVERLTDELRQLVGRGARPVRLVTLPVLRELSRVDSSLGVVAMGSAIRDYLIGSIDKLTAVYGFQGNVLDGATLRWVLRLLLGIEGCRQSADKRRERVLHILELPYPLGQMRRPHSPERELLRILAVEMVSAS